MVLSNKGKDEEYAIEHRATDIEKTIWNTRESYNNYEPADEIIKVW